MDRAVIFDVDGTLVDSVDLHAAAWQEALRAFGHDIPFQRVREQIGKGGDQLMPVFMTDEEVRSRGQELEQFRKRLFLTHYLLKVRPFKRVRELFERIRADDQRIALATSAQGVELETYKGLLRIGDLLAAESSKDDVRRSKPHPDIFESAIRRLGIDRAGVTVVGDTPYDAEAARRANVPVIGMLCGGFDATWLRDAGCVALFRDPEDLLERYEESPLARRR